MLAAISGTLAREAALGCARRGQRVYLLGSTCAPKYSSIAPTFGGDDDWFVSAQSLYGPS